MARSSKQHRRKGSRGRYFAVLLLSCGAALTAGIFSHEPAKFSLPSQKKTALAPASLPSSVSKPAISRQSSATSHQPPAIPRALNPEPRTPPSAISHQPSAISHQLSFSLDQLSLPPRIRQVLDGEPVEESVGELELSRVPSRSEAVALTFDAHFEQAHVNTILKALADGGVRATFFLTGSWCERYPDAVKKIAAAGHELCNHTYSHPDLTKLYEQEILEEVRRTEEAIRSALNDEDAKVLPFVRCPYGARSKEVVMTLLRAGYVPVYWGLDSLDSKAGITAEQVKERVLSKVKGGDIVLLHATSEATSQALPQIIEGLKAKGLQPVSLTDLLRPLP